MSDSAMASIYQTRINLALCLLLISSFNLQHSGYSAVTIFPSPRARLCFVGDRQEVTCNSTGFVLKWQIFFQLEDGLTAQLLPVPLISSTTLNEIIRVVNTSTLTFSRISERGLELPLISRLVIDTISSNLNGTSITCMEENTAAMATTTVHIAGNMNDRPNSPLEVNISEQFESEGVFVTLQWTRRNSFISYNVSVVPWTSVMFNNSKATLTVTYNTPYNVSIVEFCGHHNFTTIVGLNYTSCEKPWPLQESQKNKNHFITVTGYTNPAINGSSVTFSCPPGMFLNGPETSICMKNGKWEPDHTELECVVNETADCLSQTCAEPDTDNLKFISIPVIIIVVILGIVILFITLLKSKGPNLWHKRTSKSDNNITLRNVYEDQDDGQSNQVTSTGLIYADIGPSSFKKRQPIASSALELDDNRVEYAQLNHIVVHKAPVQSLSSPNMVNNELSADDNLSIDLDKLLIQLKPQVSPKWYQFGEAAGIEKEILDNYAQNCAPDDCIIEVLDCWLRNHTDSEAPTWREVAEILKKIDLHQLAYGIEQVYTTGKLPINIDMEEVPQGLLSHSVEELPPPIPPKMIWPNENDTLTSEVQSVLPAPLPPKQQNDACVDAPPRPPKPLK